MAAEKRQLNPLGRTFHLLTNIETLERIHFIPTLKKTTCTIAMVYFKLSALFMH